MSRFFLRSTQHFLDAAIVAVAFVCAFLLRFDGELPEQMLKRMVFLLPYVVGIRMFVLFATGVPRFAWRFVGMRESGRILQAVLLGSAILVLMRVIGGELQTVSPRAQYMVIPYGVILIDLILAFLGTTGVRILWRLRNERRSRARHNAPTHAGSPARALLVGAGSAGVQVARQLSARPDMGLMAVGFLDDDAMKRGLEFHGVRVLGTTGDLTAVVQEHQIAEVIITIAHASTAQIRRIVSLCDEAQLPTKIIPGLHEILDGRVELSRIRKVSIHDLLGRAAVSLDLDLVGSFIAQKSILVTGAGGSIGAELCRQIARLEPRKLVLVERAEPSLFQIHRELQSAFPDLELVPAMADVCDDERVRDIFELHGPEVIFHAAAHKHVPLMEINAGEAIKNNVFGTRTVARAADAFGSESFVLVSTDKAVNPTSIMGSTKRVAEVIVQALGQESKTRFAAVRFGNVLGSAGSVIPIFREQIATGGPVTVTHPEMVRYFMTIPEASQLVVQAGAMAEGGEIFALDMGEPVRIVDLAEDMIRLSGLDPHDDIEIVFSGVRPGEKLFEELGFDAEAMDTTGHPKIFQGKLAPIAHERVESGLTRLGACRSSQGRDQVMEALRELVPELQADARERPVLPPASLAGQEPAPEPGPPEPSQADSAPQPA
ncbi:MAG: polysaccharide biosynthesis protein [Deltaproteobacteria bacterium]|nr:polysaccharide biosynthesis protein [Deltaproteobacteria bacterium]